MKLGLFLALLVDLKLTHRKEKERERERDIEEKKT